MMRRMSVLLRFVLGLGLSLVLMDSQAFAQEVVETTSLLDVYRQGGLLMHGLLICSMALLALVGMCFVKLRGQVWMPGRLVRVIEIGNEEELREVMEAECKMAGGEQGVQSARSELGQLLGIAGAKQGKHRMVVENALLDHLDYLENRSMRLVHYFNVLASMAPMIGLLGTVSGMIKSFRQLALGQADPSDLAGGIGEAMSTTAGGLLVGIPAMFFFFFFRNRVSALMGDLQRRCGEILEVAFEGGKFG